MGDNPTGREIESWEENLDPVPEKLSELGREAFKLGLIDAEGQPLCRECNKPIRYVGWWRHIEEPEVMDHQAFSKSGYGKDVLTDG